MGTAHGRVKITVEDRSLQLLADRLQKMQKVMESMDRRMAAMAKGMTAAEKQTDKAAKSMDRATRSMDRGRRSFFRTSKSVRGFGKDVGDTVEDLTKLVKVAGQIRQNLSPLEKMGRILLQYQRAGGGVSGLALSLGNVNRQAAQLSITVDRLTRSWDQHNRAIQALRGGLVAGAAGFSIFWNQGILGKNRAIGQMPVIAQHINRLSQAGQLFGRVMPIAAAAAAGPWAIGLAKAAAANQRFHTSIFATLDRLDLFDSRLGVVTNRLRSFIGSMDQAGRTTQEKSRQIGKAISDIYKGANGFPKAAQQVLTGVALMNAGVQGLISRFAWLGRIPKYVLLPLIAAIGAGPAALELFGKALIWVSNTLLGLLDGLKQLSGGLLALPGIIATVTAAGVSLFAVFSGLSDLFGDIWDAKDAEELAEALAALPPHLRGLGKLAKEFKDRWKEVQTVLQIRAFDGLENQLRPLIDRWLPRMQTNILQVVTAFRAAKDSVVEWLAEAQTGRDINSLYQHTAQIINTLTSAIRPALAGFRDLGVVGSAFGRDISGWIPVIVDRFAAWAKVNRENGNLLKWMHDSVDGARDLVMGLTDVTKALWTVLTAFSTNTGDNALERFADWAEKLNAAVEKSAATGFIRELADGVRNLGLERVEQLKDLFRQVSNMLREVIPFVHDIASAFSDTFMPILEWAMSDIKNFAMILNALGIDSVIGWILGLVAAFKLIPEVLGPVRNAVQTAWGAFLVFRNSDKIFKALDTALLSVGAALENFGRLGRRAGGALIDIEGGAKRLIGTMQALAFSVGSVAAVVGFAFLQIHDNQQYLNDGFKQLDENLLNTVKHVRGMKEAFTADNGMVGKSVMAQVQVGLDAMMNDLENTAANAPGFWRNIQDTLFGGGKRTVDAPIFPMLFSQTEDFNKLQKVGQDAERARAKLTELQTAGIDLTAVIASSDSEFAKFISNLRSSGENGNEAADALENQRNILKNLEADFKKIGPAGVQVSNGIKLIAESAGDATSKLEGLRSILTGLGILKVAENDALFSYAEAIKELANTASELQGVNLGNFLNAEGTDWNRNAGQLTEGAITLRNALASIGNEFLTLSAAGGDTTQAYANFESQLQTLSQATGVSIETLKMLAAQEGLVPKETKIALSVEGKEQAVQDLFEIYLEAQKNLGKGVKVPVQVEDPEKFDRELEKLIGRDVADVNGTLLELKPDLKPEELDRIAAELAKVGIEVPVKPVYGPQIGEGQAQGNGQPTGNPIDEMIAGAQGKLDEASDKAQAGGQAFTSDFAQGILDRKDEVIRAADEVAQAARDRMPGSPAKKGPLSGSGWSGKSGQAYTSDFAWGIESRAGEVRRASTGIAGEAAGALGSGAGVEAAGEYLGQLSRLVNFGARIAEVMGQIAETTLGFVKFISDPMGKGTFFGQHVGFRRDPALSDEMLRKRQEDAAQQRISSMLESGRRDTSWYDQNTGGAKGRVGKLGPNPGKQDIANYIIDQAMARGYSREQANQFLIQAVGESGLDPRSENPNGWFGIFQFDKSTWEQAGGGEMLDPQNNIDNYFKLAEQRGLTPQNFGQGSQLGTQVSIGGPWHPDNAALGHLDQAQAAAQQFIQAYQANVGQFFDTQGLPGVPSMPGNFEGTKLRPGEGVEAGLEPAAALVAALLSSQFPGITDIGGKQNRPAGSPQIHTNGRALDVMIGDDLATGDAIAEFVKANFDKLGIESYIWRNIGLNLKDNEGGGAGSTYNAEGHFDHVHIQFADGGTADIGPNGTNLQVPVTSAGRDNPFGLPSEPGVTPTAPPNLVTRNPDGTFTPIHQGSGNLPGEKLNPLTGKPWTPEEAAAFWNDPRNAIQYDQSRLQQGDLGTPGTENRTTEEMLKELQTQTPILEESLLTAKNPNATDDERAIALSNIQAEIDRQTALDTPASRAKAAGLESAKSDAMQQFGFTEQANPIDQATQIASGAASIAGDIFKVLDSSIQAVGATKDLTSMIVRGPSNTEDIFAAIDRIQKYIQLGADIAGAVSSVAGAVGSIVSAASAAGAADPTGGAGAGLAAASTVIQGISQIAGLVQSALETVNAIIDLGQEAYRIVGSYVGDFLGFLVGGAGGKLEGDVKFLLDEMTGNLTAYSRDNPLDKREHPLPGADADPNVRNQAIGQINVIGGYGQDPRDLTRQMMWQVNTAQFAGAGVNG